MDHSHHPAPEQQHHHHHDHHSPGGEYDPDVHQLVPTETGEVLGEHHPHHHHHHVDDDLHTKQEELTMTAVAAAHAAASMEHSEVNDHHHHHSHDPHMLVPAPDDPSVATNNSAITGVATAASTTDAPVSEATRKPPPKRRRTTSGVPSKKNFSLASARPFNDMLFDLIHYKVEHGDLKVPASHKLYPWIYELRRKMRALQQQQQNNQVGGGFTTNNGNTLVQPLVFPNTHHNNDSNEQPPPCDLTHKRVQVLNHLGFVWDTFKEDAQQKWNALFQQLVQYKDKHGHCNVPAKEGELGAWVKQQRYCKTVADQKEAGTLRKSCKSGAMSKERQAQLESIGFQWKVAPPITGWNNRYEQLMAYKAANGHCNVPQYYKPDKYFGRWVMKQRHEHSLKLRGLKSQLTDEREQKLNAIGFRWVAPGFQKKSVVYHPEDEEDQANNNRTRNNASNHAPVPGILPAPAQYAAVMHPHVPHHHHHMPTTTHHHHHHMPTTHHPHTMMMATNTTGHHNPHHDAGQGAPPQQQPTIEEQAAALAMDV